MRADIRPVRLFGIRYSPNPAAEEVRRYLGVPFPVIPLKVITDANNNRKIGLALTVDLFAFNGNFNLGLARRAAAEIIRGTDACYVSSLHTIFVGNVYYNEYCSRHENLHGWAASMNKEFRATRTDEEKGIVLDCIDEGIAVWGAQRITGIDPNKRDRHPYACDVLTADEFTRIVIPRIRRIAKVLLCDVRPRDKFLYANAASQLENNSYETGLYFVSTAIDYLENHGVSENEILVALVQNPPATINQLANPLGFAEDLLALH